ncbi:type II toxin-antitoxin system VapC family toxin [Microbacterium album]|uniref:Ribonuclease VapC n=1 Tax=Microbacterium album TaxID=2053191 RepID=A0A917IGB2_9MICO|nr:type II toxin-antitoxin system VapC family toxin [Microbacterium album]GGH43735.1 VapC ribonuclease Y4jK [Microbacterium album]
MIVLDTNIVSETLRREPSPVVLDWLDAQAQDTLYLSAITCGELRFGVETLAAGARRDRLRSIIDAILELYEGRILAYDARAAIHYGRIAARARTAGRPLPVADGLIAATAAAHGYAVATRNDADFAAAGIEIINPWRVS